MYALLPARWQTSLVTSGVSFVPAGRELPIAGLAADTKGNLYGATVDGGSFTGCSAGCGVLFKVTP